MRHASDGLRMVSSKYCLGISTHALSNSDALIIKAKRECDDWTAASAGASDSRWLAINSADFPAQNITDRNENFSLFSNIISEQV